MEPSPNWAEQLVAWSAVASALLTLGLLLFAWFAWGTARATLEESRRASLAAQRSAKAAQAANEQLRRDSFEQTRPYVYAEVLPGLAGLATWDIRVTNSGRSAARNLLMTPSSWPARDDRVTQALKELCSTPRTLPPNCSIRAIWRIGPPRDGESTNGPSVMGMDENGDLKVTYHGDDDDRSAFADTFDMNTHGAGLWPVPESGPNPDSLTGETRLFYKLIQTLTRRVGEIGR